MSNTYISFDANSGRIMSVHHGASNEKEALAAVSKISKRSTHREENSHQLQMLSVPSASLSHEKRYKVDVVRKTLIETNEPVGVGFGFGSATHHR